MDPARDNCRGCFMLLHGCWHGLPRCLPNVSVSRGPHPPLQAIESSSWRAQQTLKIAHLAPSWPQPPLTRTRSMWYTDSGTGQRLSLSWKIAMECSFHLLHPWMVQHCACRLAGSLERASLPNGRASQAADLAPSSGCLRPIGHDSRAAEG